MKITFKKIMGICLSMVLAFNLALPVYAESSDEFEMILNENDCYFSYKTGNLIVGKVIEDKIITDIFLFQKIKLNLSRLRMM